MAQQPTPHAMQPASKASPAVPAQQFADTPQRPASLLDEPAKPAQIQLDNGKLSVKADNSMLSTILHDISAKTGMTVDGLSRDQRIFGSYGPGTPREIVASLLDGMGYNVVMVGSLENGAPRQVLLTPRAGGLPKGPQGVQAQAFSQNNNADDDDTAPEPQDTAPVPPRPEANAPPPADQQQQSQPGQNGVKTPQQMLQELQDMRTRQLQQQQQQSNPQ
ncbi:MAG TPA: hypothetical protein VHT24_15560 [Pseudacidobacterium sp.]|nr:hypothetical protein [Pseudacidobacterium sp.]